MKAAVNTCWKLRVMHMASVRSSENSLGSVSFALQYLVILIMDLFLRVLSGVLLGMAILLYVG